MDTSNKENPSIVALIPARSGSMRVPDKNIRYLSGHPLMAYTITAAIKSGIFSKVVNAMIEEGHATLPSIDIKPYKIM